ncbi:protein TASOR, partial [Biomphalaria glabrata]
GKMKTVLCKNVGVQLEPTPNYDCHIAKPNVDQATQLAPYMLLYTTQLYLYEYSDCEIVDYPRQVLPYAVVYYTYKEPQPMIPKPITSTPQSQLPMPSVVPPLSSTQTPVNPHQSQAAQHQDSGPCNEVWRGRLHVRLEAGGQIYIDVTMLSHFVPLTINLISPILIHHLYPEHNAQFTFFCGLSNIALKDEVEWRAHFFKSFLMRPRPNNEEHFKALVKHISAKREMPTVKLPNDVFLFMMPNCLLASQLGLVRRDDDTPVLHCVLMSKYSTNEAQRKKLLDRKTIFKNYGSATSWESLFDDSDFTDEEDVKMKGQLSGSMSSMFQEQRYIQNKLAAMSIVDADMNFTRCSCRKLSSSKAHHQRCRDSDVARVLAACQSSGKKMSQPAVQDRSQHRPKQKMSKRTKSMPSFSPHGSDSDSEVENGNGTSRRRKDRLTLLSSTKTVEEELSEEELTNEQMEDIIFLRKPALTTVSRPKPPSQAHKNSSSSFQNNQKHSRAKSAVPQPSSDLHKSSSEPLFNVKPRIIPTEPLEPVTLPKTKIIPSEPRLIPTEPVDNLEGTKTSKKENDKPLKNELNFRNIHQVIDRTLKSELATSKLVKPEQSLGKPLNPGINTGKHSSLTVPVSKSSNPEVITSKPLNSGITTSKSSNPGVISSKTELISTSQISQPELMSGKPLKPVLSTNKLSNPEPDITTSKPSASQDNFVPKSILKKNSDLLVPTIIEPIPPVSVDEVSGLPKKKLARLEEDFGDVDMRIPMAGPVTLHPVFLAARQPPAIILSPPTTEPTQHSPNFSLGSWLAPSEIQGACVPPNACDVISSMSPTSPESPPIGSPPSPVDSPLSPPMDSHSPPHSPITVIDTESPASPPQSSLQDRFRSSPIAIPTTRIIHNTSPDISRLSSPACSSGSRERIDNANDMKNFLNSGFDSDLDSSYEDESVVTDQEICVSCSHYPVARQKETVWKDNKTQVQDNPNQSACKHGDQKSEDTVREAHNAKDSSLSPDYQIAAKTFTVSCVYTDCTCVDRLMGKLFSNPILQSCMQECTKPTCVDSDTSHEPCVSNRDAVADGHCISETKTWKQTLDVKTDSERVNILESQTESLLLADSIVRRCTNKYKKSLADAMLSSAYSFCNQWEEKRDHPGKCMILKNAVALREIENCSDSPMDSWCKEMRSEKAHLFGSGHCILGQCDLVTVWPCSVKSETGQTDDAPSHENQLQVFQESASQDTVSVAQIKLSSGVKDFGEHSHESAEMQKETNLSDLESQQLSCSYSHNGLLDTSAKKNPANEAKNPSKLLFKNISEGKKHRKSHHAKAGYDPSHTNSSSRDDRQKKRDGIERNPTDKKNQPRKPKESNPKHHEDQGYSGSKQKPVQVTATIKTTNQINNQPISNSSKHLNQRELQPIDQLEQDLSKLKTDISVEIPDQWDGNADQQKRLHKNKCLSDVPESTDLVQSICSSPPCLQRKSHYHPRSSHQANDQKDPSKKLLISRDVLQQCFSDQFKGMTMSVLADSKFAVCDTQSHNDSEQSHQFSIAHSVLDEVKFPDYGTTSSNNNLLLGSNIEGSITDVSDVDSRDVYNNNSNYLMSASTFECSYRNQSVAFEDGTKSKVKESHSKSGQTHSNKSHCDDKHPKHCHGNFSIKGSVMSHYDGNDNYLEKCHGTDSIRDPNNLNQNASDKHPNKCHGKGSIRDHIKFNQNASDKHPNRCHNKSSIDVPNWSYHYDSEKHPNKCHERCTIKDFYKSHHYDSEKHPNKCHGNKDPSKHQIKENHKNSYKYHSTDPHNDNDKDSHSDFNRSHTRDSNLYPNKCHSKDSHNDHLKYHKGSNNSKKKHHLKDSNHLWEKETQLKLHNSSEINTDLSHNKQEHRIKIDCLSSSANSPSESSACTDLDYVKHAEGEINTQENAKHNEPRIIQTFNLMHRRDIRPTRHKVSRSKRFRNTTKSRRKHEEKLLYSCETEVDSPPPCYQRKGSELCPTAAGHKKQKQRHGEITCSKRYFSRSKVRYKADVYDASSEDEDKDKMWSLSLSVGKLGSRMACTTPRLQRDFIRDAHPCIEDIDDSGFASIPLSMRSVINRGDTLVSSHRVVSKSLFQEDTLKNQSFNTLENKSRFGSLVRECLYETDNFSVHDTPEECDSDNSWFTFARHINRKNQVHVCQPSPLTQRNLGETQTTQYNEDIDSFQEVKPFISQLEQLTYYRIEEQVGSMAVQDEQLGFGYMKRSPQDPNCNLGEPCVVIDRVEETMEDFFLDQAERDCTNPSALTQLDSLTEQSLAQSEGNMHSSPLHPTMDTYNDTNQILQTHSDTSEKHQSGHPSYNRVQEDFSTQKHRNIKPKKKSLLYQCSSSQSEPSLLQNSLTNKDVEEMNQCSNKTSSFLESRNKSMSAYQSPNWPAEEYSTSNSVYHYRAIIDQYRPINAPLPEKDNRWSYMNRDKEELSAPFLQDSQRDHTCSFSPISTNSTLTALDIVLETDEDIKKQETEDKVTCDSDLARKQNQVMPNLNVYRKIQTDRSPIDLAKVHKHSPDRSINTVVPDQTHTKVCRNIFTDIQPAVLKTHTLMNESHEVMIDKSSVEKNTDKSQALLDKQCHNQSALNETLHNKASLSQFSCSQLSQSLLSSRHPCKETNDVRFSSSESDEGMSAQLKSIVEQVISGHSRPSDKETILSPCDPLVSNSNETVEICYKQQVISSTDQSLPWITIASPDLSQQETIQNKKHQSSFSEQNVNISSRKINFSLNKVNNWLTAEKAYLFPASSRQQTSMDDTNRPFNDSQSLNQSSSMSQRTCDSDNGNRLLASNTPSLPSDKHWTIPKRGDSSVCTSLSYEHIPDLQAMNNVSKNSSRTLLEEEGNSDNCSMPQADLYLSQTNGNLENGHTLTFEQPEEKDFSQDKFCLSQDGANSYPVMNLSKTDNVSSSSSDPHTLDETMNSNDMFDGEIYLTDTEYVLNNICRPCSVSLCDVDKYFNLCGGNSFYLTSESISQVCRIPSRSTARPSESLNSLASSSKIPEHKSCVEENTCQGMDDVQEIQAGSEAHGVEINEKSHLKENNLESDLMVNKGESYLRATDGESHFRAAEGESHLRVTEGESHLRVSNNEAHLIETDGQSLLMKTEPYRHHAGIAGESNVMQTDSDRLVEGGCRLGETDDFLKSEEDEGYWVGVENHLTKIDGECHLEKTDMESHLMVTEDESHLMQTDGDNDMLNRNQPKHCESQSDSVLGLQSVTNTTYVLSSSNSKDTTQKYAMIKVDNGGALITIPIWNQVAEDEVKDKKQKKNKRKTSSKENTEKQTCNKSGLSVSKENTEKQTCNKSGHSVSKENTEKQTCNKSGHSVSKENTEKQTCNKSGYSVSKENTEKQTCNKSGYSVSKENTEKQTCNKSGHSVSKENTEKQTCNKSGLSVSKRKATSEQEDLISVKRKKMNPSQDNISVKQQPASSVGGNEVEETISGQEKLLIENYLFPTSVNRYKFQSQLITQTEQHSQKSGENMVAKSKKQTSKQQTLSEQQTSKLQTLSEPIRDVTSEDTSNGNKTNEVIVDANVESKAQSEVSMNSSCPSNRQNIPSKRIHEPVDCQASVQGSDEMKEEINDNTVFPSPTCSTPDALKFPPTGTSSSLSSKEPCKAKEKTSKVNEASKHQTSVKVNKCTKDHKANKEHKSLKGDLSTREPKSITNQTAKEIESSKNDTRSHKEHRSSKHHTTSNKEHKSLKGDLSTHEPKSLTNQTAKESKSSKNDTTSHKEHKSSKHQTTSTKEDKSSKGDLSTNEPKSLTDLTAKETTSLKHHTTSKKEHKSSKGDLSTNEPKSTDQTAKESTSSKNDTTSNKEHKSSKHHTTSNKEHKSLKGDLSTNEPKSLTDKTAKESTSSKNDTTSNKEHKSSKHHTTSNKEHKSLKGDLSTNEPKSLTDQTAKESTSSKNDTTSNKEHKSLKHHTTSNKEHKSSKGNLLVNEPKSLIHQTSVKENKSSKNDTISNKKNKSLVGDLPANEPKKIIDQTSAKEIQSSENHTTSHKEQNTSKGDLPANEPKSLPDQKAKEIKSTKKDTIINKEHKSSKHHISSNKEHKSSKHHTTSNKEHKTSKENLSSNEPKSLIDQTSSKESKPSKNHTTSNKEHKSSKEHKTDKMQKKTREHITSKEHTSDEKHFVQDNKSTEEHKLTKEHLLSKKQISSKEHTSAKECLSNIEHNSSKKHTSVKEHTSSREHASSKKQTSVKEQTSGKEHSSGKDNFSSQERIASSSIACNKDLQIAAEEKRSIHKPFKLCKHMSTKQHKNKEHTSSELKPSKHIAPEKKHKPSKEHSSAKELKSGKTDTTNSLITKNKVISSLLKDIVSQLDANSAAWHNENTNLKSTKDNKQAIKVIKQLPENNQLAVDLHGDNKPEVNNQFSEDSDLAHQVNNLVLTDNKIVFEVSNQLSEDNNLELEVNHQVPADDKLADEVINQLPEDQKLALEVNNQLSEDNELALEVDNRITEDSKVALEVNNDLLKDSNLALEDNVQKHELNKVALQVNNQLPGNYELLLEVNDQLPGDHKLTPEVNSHLSETKQEFEVRHHLPEDHNLILIKDEAPLSINSEATVDMLEPDLKKQTDVINELAPEVNKKPFEVNNQVHILNCQPQEVNKKAKKRKADHEKNLADKPGTFCPSAQHNETLTDRLETSSVTEEGNDDVDKINTNSHKEEHPLQSSKKATISFSSDAKKLSMQSQSSLLLDQTATMAGFASGSGNQKVTSKEVKRKADEVLSGEQYTKKPAHVMWSNWKIPKKKKNEVSAKCIEEQPQKSKEDRTDAMKLDFGRFHLPISSSHKQTSSYLQTSSNQASSSCQSLKTNKIQVCSGQQLLNSSNPAKKTIFGSNSKKDNCESTPRNIVSKKQQIIRTTYTSEKKIIQTSDTSEKQEYKDTNHSIVSEKHLDTHIMREQPDEMFSTSKRPEKDVLEGQCDIFKNKEKWESPETLCPEVEPSAKCETAAIEPQVTNNESEVVAEMTYTDSVSTAVHLVGATVSLDKDEKDDPIHLRINLTPLDLQRTTSAVDDLEKTENDLSNSEGKVDKSSESFPTVNLRDSQDITHSMEFLKKDNGDRRHMEQDSLEGEICKGKPGSFLEEMACTANHCDINIGQNQDPMVTHLSGNCPLNDPSDLSNLNIDSKNYSCKSSVKGMADMTEQGSLKVKAMLSSANLELNHGNAHEPIQERKVTDRSEWNSSPVRGLQDKTEESCEPTNSAGDVQDYQKMCDEAPACSSKVIFSFLSRQSLEPQTSPKIESGKLMDFAPDISNCDKPVDTVASLMCVKGEHPLANVEIGSENVIRSSVSGVSFSADDTTQVSNACSNESITSLGIGLASEAENSQNTTTMLCSEEGQAGFIKSTYENPDGWSSDHEKKVITDDYNDQKNSTKSPLVGYVSTDSSKSDLLKPRIKSQQDSELFCPYSESSTEEERERKNQIFLSHEKSRMSEVNFINSSPLRDSSVCDGTRSCQSHEAQKLFSDKDSSCDLALAIKYRKKLYRHPKHHHVCDVSSDNKSSESAFQKKDAIGDRSQEHSSGGITNDTASYSPDKEDDKQSHSYGHEDASLRTQSMDTKFLGQKDGERNSSEGEIFKVELSASQTCILKEELCLQEDIDSGQVLCQVGPELSGDDSVDSDVISDLSNIYIANTDDKHGLKETKSASVQDSARKMVFPDADSPLDSSRDAWSSGENGCSTSGKTEKRGNKRLVNYISTDSSQNDLSEPKCTGQQRSAKTYCPYSDSSTEDKVKESYSEENGAKELYGQINPNLEEMETEIMSIKSLDLDPDSSASLSSSSSTCDRMRSCKLDGKQIYSPRNDSANNLSSESDLSVQYRKKKYNRQKHHQACDESADPMFKRGDKHSSDDSDDSTSDASSHVAHKNNKNKRLQTHQSSSDDSTEDTSISSSKKKEGKKIRSQKHHSSSDDSSISSIKKKEEKKNRSQKHHSSSDDSTEDTSISPSKKKEPKKSRSQKHESSSDDSTEDTSISPSKKKEPKKSRSQKHESSSDDSTEDTSISSSKKKEGKKSRSQKHESSSDDSTDDTSISLSKKKEEKKSRSQKHESSSDDSTDDTSISLSKKKEGRSQKHESSSDDLTDDTSISSSKKKEPKKSRSQKHESSSDDSNESDSNESTSISLSKKKEGKKSRSQKHESSSDDSNEDTSISLSKKKEGKKSRSQKHESSGDDSNEDTSISLSKKKEGKKSRSQKHHSSSDDSNEDTSISSSKKKEGKKSRSQKHESSSDDLTDDTSISSSKKKEPKKSRSQKHESSSDDSNVATENQSSKRRSRYYDRTSENDSYDTENQSQTRRSSYHDRTSEDDSHDTNSRSRKRRSRYDNKSEGEVSYDTDNLCRTRRGRNYDWTSEDEYSEGSNYHSKTSRYRYHYRSSQENSSDSENHYRSRSRKDKYHYRSSEDEDSWDSDYYSRRDRYHYRTSRDEDSSYADHRTRTVRDRLDYRLSEDKEDYSHRYSACNRSTTSGQHYGDIESFPYKADFSHRDRSNEHISEDRKSRRAHPYSRPERKDFASFNLPYKDLAELMQSLTTETFKQSKKCYPIQNKPVKRFASYCFKRSSVPKSKGKEKATIKLVRPEDIPDIDKRKHLADEVENLTVISGDEVAKKTLEDILQMYPSIEKSNTKELGSDEIVEVKDTVNQKVLVNTSDIALPVPAVACSDDIQQPPVVSQLRKSDSKPKASNEPTAKMPDRETNIDVLKVRNDDKPHVQDLSCNLASKIAENKSKKTSDLSTTLSSRVWCSSPVSGARNKNDQRRDPCVSPLTKIKPQLFESRGDKKDVERFNVASSKKLQAHREGVYSPSDTMMDMSEDNMILQMSELSLVKNELSLEKDDQSLVKDDQSLVKDDQSLVKDDQCILKEDGEEKLVKTNDDQRVGQVLTKETNSSPPSSGKISPKGSILNYYSQLEEATIIVDSSSSEDELDIALASQKAVLAQEAEDSSLDSTENSSQQPGQSEEITPGVHECESAAKGQKYKIHPFNSGSDMSLDEDNCDTHCRIIYVRSAHTSAKLADTQSETCLSDKGSSHSDLVSRASVSDTGLASQVKSFSSGHECETKSDSDLKASVNAASYFNFSCRHFSSFNTLYSLPSFSDMSSNEPRTIAPNLFPHMAYRDPCSAQQSPQNKQSSPAFISKRKRQQMMKVTKCNLEKSSEFMLVIQSLKDLKLSPHRSEKRDLKLAKPTQPFCLEMSPSSENPVCVEHPTHPSHIEHQSHPKMPLCTKQSPCREQIYLDHPELPGQTSCSPHSSFPNQPSVSPHSSFPNQPSVSPHSSLPNHPSCSPHSSLTNHPSCSPHSSLTNHPSLPPLMLHPSFPQPPLFLKQSLIQKYSLYLEQSPLIQPHPMYLEQPPLIQPHPMYPKQPPLIQPHPMYPEQPPLIQPLPMYPEQPPLIQPHPMYPDQSSFPQYPPFLEEPVLPQPSLLTEQQPQHIELPVTRINEAVSPTSKSLKSCHQLCSNLCSPSTEHHTLTSPQVSLSNTCASNSDETVDIEPDNHGSCSQTWAEQEPPPQVEETESSNSTLEILQKYLITASRLISDSEHARQLKQCKKTKPHTASGQSVDSDLNTSGTQSGELSENTSHIVPDGETSSNQELERLGQPNDALKLSNAKNKMRLTDLLYIKKQRELNAEENTQLSKLLALVKTKVLEKQKQVLPSGKY